MPARMINNEEEVEAMQQPRPQREARVNRPRGAGDTRVAQDEVLHAGHGAQLLGDGDPADQEGNDERHRPQYIRSSRRPTGCAGPRRLGEAARCSGKYGHPQRSSLPREGRGGTLRASFI